MAKAPIQSAKFKKDFVAFSAILLFCIIVLGEIMVAGFLPYHLQRETALAKPLAQRKLALRFDSIRRSLFAINDKTPVPGDAELSLMTHALNQFSNYMRDYSMELSVEQCSAISERLLSTHKRAVLLHNPQRCASRRVLFSPEKFEQSLRGLSPERIASLSNSKPSTAKQDESSSL